MFLFLPFSLLYFSGFMQSGDTVTTWLYYGLLLRRYFVMVGGDVRFVGLLLGSIVFNYGAGYLIGQKLSISTGSPKWLLVSAIVANMMLLGYFKYANFFVENLNYLTGTKLLIGEVFLPLGISFFTFTQIAYLVDTYQGKVKEYNFIHYTLFVT